tara:strand:+ start:352 stop:741 length:390 start_codon:yes stop_codon:yes gene_type:complete
MSESFNIEIISPDKTIFKSEVGQVTIPSFEGLMTILKNHIPLVTFLRPGFIEINSNNKNESFFVEDGTVEFSKNKLLILTSTAINKKDLKDDIKDQIIKEAHDKMSKEGVSDKEKYIYSYKISSLEKAN